MAGLSVRSSVGGPSLTCGLQLSPRCGRPSLALAMNLLGDQAIVWSGLFALLVLGVHALHRSQTASWALSLAIGDVSTHVHHHLSVAKSM